MENLACQLFDLSLYFSKFQAKGLRAMINVRDLIRRKGSRVFSIPPADSVFNAMKLMAENNTGALLVMNGGAGDGDRLRA